MNREEKKNLVTIASELADSVAVDSPDQLALMEELSERQQVIMRFKMRGLSQKATAQLLDISKGLVSQEMKAIRAHYVTRGSDADQAAIVGETLEEFDEVRRKAWELFHTDEDKKGKQRSLMLVMTAREKQLKLQMDLGLVKRAATEHKHEVEISPLLEKMTQAQKDQIVAQIIQLSPGIDPTPPEEFENMVEAEAVDYEPEKD